MVVCLSLFHGGTYLVDQQMLEDLRTERFNTHASNLGAILANEFAEKYHVPAFIVDPVVVDELQPLADFWIKRHSAA